MTSKLAHAIEALDNEHHNNLIVGVVLRIEDTPRSLCAVPASVSVFHTYRIHPIPEKPPTPLVTMLTNLE